MNNNKNYKTRNLVSVIVAIIVFVISFFVAKHVIGLFTKNNFGPELQKSAIDLNRQAPLMINSYTRLDSVTTNNKNTFNYFYTLIDSDKSEISLDMINNQTRLEIIKSIKTSEDLKLYRDNNITMTYSYFDKNGAYITNISVTPDLYK